MQQALKGPCLAKHHSPGCGSETIFAGLISGPEVRRGLAEGLEATWAVLGSTVRPMYELVAGISGTMN